MRPEKSKLLKISLCVLSCVFFGCGNSKPNSNGTGILLTSKGIKDELNKQKAAPSIHENSPFMKILSSAMAKVLGDKTNSKVQTLGKYIDENGNINADFQSELEDPDSEASKELILTLEEVIDSINAEVERSLSDFKLDDSFGVTEDAIKEWMGKGLKNKEVAKVISAWQVIFSEYSKFNENHLKFLIKSGKGWMHRSTVKAIDLAWRNFVTFLEKGCEKCDQSLQSFKNSKHSKDKKAAQEAETVIKAISDEMENIRGFIANKNSIRVNALKNVYTLIGNQFLPKYGDVFFDLINIQTRDQKSEEKVTSDWGNAVFNHFYLGVKSDRSSFSNPACAFKGKTISKLKIQTQYKDLFAKYADKYKSSLKDFVKFAIDKGIISTKYFQTDKVDIICKYLECYGNEKDNNKVNKGGRKDISLSPWLMLCAKNNWTAINQIVHFETGKEGQKDVWTVKYVDQEINNINDLVKRVNADNKNYDQLEVYAGILALCNLCYGLRHYLNGTTAGDTGDGFNLSNALRELATDSALTRYARKGRLKQWETFKKAAENGELKDK